MAVIVDDKLIVLDIGGSIVAPHTPDTVYLRRLLSFLTQWLEEKSSRRVILVVGGGGAARAWQKAARELTPLIQPDSLDWIGIMATRLNAELLKVLLGSLCPDEVVCNPGAAHSFAGRVLLAAGWKPGFSTDYDAVLLAERYEVGCLIMLSNIAQVYDADPRTHPQAKPIEKLTWREYHALSGEKWSPGANVPFDPVAAKKAALIGLTVVAADGHDLDNLQAILRGGEFVGTVITPDPPKG
ncbi:MAG: UMP kinase [Spirochaeta sp. LUC14_002_19_P3]|nr:MAG: UMP kinase [Spirochaeta sp. LUC14_002_19_P3]